MHAQVIQRYAPIHMILNPNQNLRGKHQTTTKSSIEVHPSKSR
jgi:hypothetical protein